MSTIPSPVTTTEALGMLRVALRFLSATDATEMVTEEQAQCLQALEQFSSMSTAARASILGAFICGQGYSADADYSPRSWLIHRTRVTKGTATAHTAWVRRAAAHPRSPRRWPREGWSRSRTRGPSASGRTSCRRTAARRRTRS